METENIIKSITDLGQKIESDYATKHEMKKFADAVSALDKAIERKSLEERLDQNVIFANKGQAQDFINVLKGALARDNKVLTPDSGFYVSKAAGDPLTSTGTNAGADIVPTTLASTFSMLLAQGSVARANATVYNGVQGTLDLGKRNGTSTAVFTAADDTAVTATQLGTSKVSLTPKQVSALSLVADKLLYVSPVNIANAIAIDLIEQAGVLEDNSVIRGDGGASYGGITGLKSASGVGSVTLTAANYATDPNLIDALLDMPSQVHESVQQSGRGRFYVSPAAWYKVRKGKASSSGVYHFDIESGQYQLGGYGLTVWHRMDSAVTATNCVAFFGDMSQSTVIGIGRDMSIEVDRSYAFNKNQTAFRLTYDFGAAHVQAGAMSRIVLT